MHQNKTTNPTDAEVRALAERMARENDVNVGRAEMAVRSLLARDLIEMVVEKATTWRATCGVDGSHWMVKDAAENPAPTGSFCPDCRERKMTAPGVLHWKPDTAAKDAIADLEDAIVDLEEVRRAVFGDVGDEPDVYADYDRCSELMGKMRRAIDVLRERL